MPTARENAIDLYMSAIRDGDARAALDRTIGARYTQHSTGVKDGKEGFLEFFEPFLERNPARDMKIVRCLQEGPHVFVHCYQNLNNGAAEWVTMDFFDSDEEGKIIEHWDCIEAFTAANPSGRSSVDGPTEITDLDQTDANMAHVQDFIETCLMKGEAEKAEGFVNGYIQHHAHLGDGIDGLAGLVNDANIALKYLETPLIVAEGNFVAALSKVRFGGIELCVADLFRLEHGKIVEH
jgi:predicted SnoaL-like aldol condensation-catalyzing enzyme